MGRWITAVAIASGSTRSCFGAQAKCRLGFSKVSNLAQADIWMSLRPWVLAANNSDFALNHCFKDSFYEFEDYFDDKPTGSFVAVAVDERTVGETKHLKLQVLGASDKDDWVWVSSGDHPNPDGSTCARSRSRHPRLQK